MSTNDPAVEAPKEVETKRVKSKISIGWMIFGLSSAAITGTLFLTTYRLSWKFLHHLQPREGQRMKRLMDYVRNERQSRNRDMFQVKSKKYERKKQWIYLGDVRIEDRLQFTHFRNAHEFWNYYSYNEAMDLATSTFLGSLVFTTSIFIVLCSLFKWYFDIQQAQDINVLLKSFFQPLRKYTKVDYELTAADEEIDQRTRDMSTLEFIESLITDFDYYQKLSNESYAENQQRKENNLNEKMNDE